MPYVMVPVPEEHVDDVMAYVVRLSARANLQPWDSEGVEALFLGVDESSRSVLSAVARGMVAGSTLTVKALAEQVELGRREALDVIRALNRQAVLTKRVELVSVQDLAEVGPDGRTREQRVLGMSAEVVEMIRAAEEVERATLPHPLQRSSG